jgi:hypothetical protein
MARTFFPTLIAVVVLAGFPAHEPFLRHQADLRSYHDSFRRCGAIQLVPGVRYQAWTFTRCVCLAATS